jgi:hypothetical protein
MYFGTFYHIVVVYNENGTVGIKEFICYTRRSLTGFKYNKNFGSDVSLYV